MISRGPVQGNLAGCVPWIILGLTLLFTLFVRIRLLSIPLERDEGEFAYMGQLLLDGIPPYLISYNMKLPGIYGAYALIMSVLDQTTSAIHLGFTVINAATVLLLFLLVRRLADEFAAAVAGATFAVLSLSPTVLGTSAHATHFVLLPALAGLLVMLKATEPSRLSRLLVCGILLGTAVLMKQPGIFFALFAFLFFLLVRPRRERPPFFSLLRESAFYWAGVVLPFGAICLALLAAGVFDRFWFWTFSYAREYVSEVPPAAALQLLTGTFPRVIGQLYPLWGLAGAGLVAIWLDRRMRPQAPVILGLLLFSFAAVCPGFYFREHYFVLMLPAVALLAGVVAASVRRLLDRGVWLPLVPAVGFLGLVAFSIYPDRAFYFQLSPAQAAREMYGLNPFPESIEVARYIAANSTEQETIAILGSEPQIPFYAGRRSATGYIYVYALMEPQPFAARMQEEMIGEIERTHPRFLVWVNVFSSWLAGSNSNRAIFEWFEGYRQGFDLVGMVDIFPGGHTVYRWDRDAVGYTPRSPHYLCIYKRKDTTSQ